MDRANGERLIRRVFHEGTGVPNSAVELSELFHADFICHGPPGMNHSHDDGPQPIELCIFSGAFENLVFEVGAVEVDDEDRLVSRFTAVGTHVHEF